MPPRLHSLMTTLRVHRIARERGNNFSLLCEASKTICAHSEAKAVFFQAC
jgi:hypothetical protein